MDEDEQDVYVAQLHEVFDSCDQNGKGSLNREELIDLCRKLQLDDQVPQLLAQLLGSEDAQGQVTFDHFKEGFVAVLSQAIDALSSSEDEEELNEQTEPPKLIVNEKRYGRKSKPDNSVSEDQYSADEESSFLESRPESRASDVPPMPHDPPLREPTEERGKVKRRISSRKSSLRNSIRRHNSRIRTSVQQSIDESEILEASGQVESPISLERRLSG